MAKIFFWSESFNNRNFTKLYLAQAVNLIGDALTWLGLALLAFELVGDRAGVVLAIALTLRVTAFVFLSPIAGVLADRVDRKRLMMTTHLCRMVLVSLLPFVSQVWQLYGLVLGLNVFSAFFTPTYSATIPLVTTPAERPQAIALSSATYQFLGVLGPGLAGALAAFVGTRQIFWLDGLTFLIATLIIALVPGQLVVPQTQPKTKSLQQILPDIVVGSQCLWADPPMRYAVSVQFVGAIVGAAILINTVGQVQGVLQLGKMEYGWVMAAFGIGAMIASLSLTRLNFKHQAIAVMTLGGIVMPMTIVFGNSANLAGLIILWLIAGAAQTCINLPTQVLIADRVVTELQGRVYGAQFAWSHFWWAFAYPCAGWLGQTSLQFNFLLSSLFGLGLMGAIVWIGKPRYETGQWHEHEHDHNSHDHDPQHANYHRHSSHLVGQARHRHLHFHQQIHE
jgi:MFS transporter, NRE family, putaive nickel resistance protein